MIESSENVAAGGILTPVLQVLRCILLIAPDQMPHQPSLNAPAL